MFGRDEGEASDDVSDALKQGSTNFSSDHDPGYLALRSKSAMIEDDWTSKCML